MRRRQFLANTFKTGMAAAITPLWMNLATEKVYGQSTTVSPYKAVVVVSLMGGNDGNNMIVPTTSAEYAQYAAVRGPIALLPGTLLPVTDATSKQPYGFNPALRNIASLFQSGSATVVANCGPLRSPANKTQLLADISLVPELLQNHTAGRAQWESAQTGSLPGSGWGGRMADLLSAQSGALPPILDAGPASIFTVGNSVQAIAVQNNSGSAVVIPSGVEAAILDIARNDSQSQNALVNQAASLRLDAASQQVLLDQAKAVGATLKTIFPATSFGNALQSIARVISGRNVIGASRQVFYCQQGNYDTHTSQIQQQAAQLTELDGGIGAFMQAMQELGLSQEVLICTHSDFNRTMQANVNQGSDHGWGNHQLILGGGIRGGRIIGNMPDFDLGGSSDYTSQGVWIPTLSVTQMTAAVGGWMGLNSQQLASVFPDLANFSAGPIVLN